MPPAGPGIGRSAGSARRVNKTARAWVSGPIRTGDPAAHNRPVDRIIDIPGGVVSAPQQGRTFDIRRYSVILGGGAEAQSRTPGAVRGVLLGLSERGLAASAMIRLDLADLIGVIDQLPRAPRRPRLLTRLTTRSVPRRAPLRRPLVPWRVRRRRSRGVRRIRRQPPLQLRDLVRLFSNNLSQLRATSRPLHDGRWATTNTHAS